MAKNIIKSLKNASKTLRPKVTMVGNSLDIDSIYNHSIPKKIIKKSVDDASETVSKTVSKLTAEEQKALDKANELWKQQREEDFLKMDTEIENMFKETDEMFGSPEEILSPDYEPRVDSTTANSAMDDPLTWTDDYILNTATDEETLNNMINQRDQAQRFKDINPDKPSTWTEEYINKTAKTPDELHDMTQRMNDAKNSGTVETINQQKNAEEVPKNRQQKKQDAKVEKAKANKERAEKIYQDAMDKINGTGDLERMEFYNSTETQRKYKFQQENQESMDSLLENKGQVNDSNKYVHNQDFDNIDADINTAQDNIKNGYKDVNGYTGNKLNSQMDEYFDGRTITDASQPRPEKSIDEISEGFDSYTANSRYVDDAGNLIKTRKVTKTFGPNPLEDVSKVGVITTGMNILGTISDYKDERRKGRGVVASAVTAGAKFAMYEALGLWAIPVALVSNAPGAIIKGADALYKENRKMNSAANFQAFGGAQFQDTQQLATMRQSGMEMAKMANYNLQQTLMGNEATYLHR